MARFTDMTALSPLTGPVTPLPAGMALTGQGARVAQAQTGVPQRRVPTRPVGPMPNADAVNAPRFVDPREAIPQMQAPQMAPPQAPPGGLGGLGGAPAQSGGGGFGDTLQALGQSMMSSPHGWWTRDFAGNMQAAQDRREQSQQQAAARNAIEQALVRMGLSPEDAAGFSADPNAVQLVAKQMQEERARAQQEAAMAQEAEMFRSLDGMGGMPSPVGGAPAAPAGSQGGFVPLGQGLPPLDGAPQPDAPAAPETPAPPMAQPAAGGDGMPDLMQRRGTLTRMLGMQTLSDAGRRRIEAEIRGIDDQIKAERDRPTDLARLIRERDALPQGHPDRSIYDDRIARLGQGVQVTNVLPGDEGAFSRAYGGGLAERALRVQDDFQTQLARLSSYERLGQLLLDDNVYTGVGGEAIQNLKRLASTLFGIEGIEGVENAEAAERIRREMFAGFRQEMLAGATSNADRQFIQEIPPNITDSKRGIALVVEIQRRAANAARERQSVLQDILDRDGTMNARSWGEYQRRAAEISVFRPEDIERARTIAVQNAKQTGPLAGLPLERLPPDILNYALEGALTPDEIRAFLATEGAR